MGLFGGGGGDDSRGSFIQFKPEDERRLGHFLNQLPGYAGAATGAANTASNNTLTNFGQFDPKLQTDFKYNPQLDAYSQAQVSQGLQQLAQQGQARSQQIGRAVGPQNQGLSNILRFQNQFQTANAGNGLGFAAATGQQGRELSQFQNTNAARLAQSQQQSNLQQLANSAWGQKAQLGQQGLQNSVLAAAAAAAGGAARGTNYNKKLEDMYQAI